jgi:hypothetical protein
MLPLAAAVILEVFASSSVVSGSNQDSLCFVAVGVAGAFGLVLRKVDLKALEILGTCPEGGRCR